MRVVKVVVYEVGCGVLILVEMWIGGIWEGSKK